MGKSKERRIGILTKGRLAHINEFGDLRPLDQVYLDSVGQVYYIGKFGSGYIFAEVADLCVSFYRGLEMRKTDSPSGLVSVEGLERLAEFWDKDGSMFHAIRFLLEGEKARNE